MKTIFLVDDNPAYLQAGKTALSQLYNTVTIPSAVKMFGVITVIKPDLILLDVDMPEMDGHEALVRLKKLPETASVPVIFLTSRDDEENMLRAFSAGAVDYILKPFDRHLLLKRVEMHLLVASQRKELEMFNENLIKMVEDKSEEIYRLQNNLIKTMGELIESRDNVSGVCVNESCSLLRIFIGAMLEFGVYADIVGAWDTELAVNASQLRDIGKISIPDRIINNRGALSEEDYEIMKKHTDIGVNIMKSIQHSAPDSEFITNGKLFAGSHHEKWDGTGYPRGLKGEEIPLQGRIMRLIDDYITLAVYNAKGGAVSHENAREYISKNAGLIFDPILAALFDKIHTRFKTASLKVS